MSLPFCIDSTWRRGNVLNQIQVNYFYNFVSFKSSLISSCFVRFEAGVCKL